MDLGSELFGATPPETLYHYTTQRGLLGILESNSLWATRIHYLNDSTEHSLASSLIKAALDKKSNGCSTPWEKEKVDYLYGLWEERVHSPICVASLSENRDLLSQWRAYSNGGGGISIGFNAARLRSNCHRDGFGLAQCVYAPMKQEEVAQAMVENAFTDNARIQHAFKQGGIDEARYLFQLESKLDFGHASLVYTPLLKHQSFSEEEEWRLVSLNPVRPPVLHFRAGVSSLIPYIPIKLGHISDLLESCTLGPTPNPELAKDALEALLLKYTGRSVPVYRTQVPYRSW